MIVARYSESAVICILRIKGKLKIIGFTMKEVRHGRLNVFKRSMVEDVKNIKGELHLTTIVDDIPGESLGQVNDSVSSGNINLIRLWFRRRKRIAIRHNKTICHGQIHAVHDHSIVR